MQIRTLAITALAMALPNSVAAQDVAHHDIPIPGRDCLYSDASCVWGRLADHTGGPGNGSRLQEGPIDVCYLWDPFCRAPAQSVCELHGPHGSDQWEQGSYFFVLKTNTSWIIKPRVAGWHLSWLPSHRTVPRDVTPGSIRYFDFSLVRGRPDTTICDF